MSASIQEFIVVDESGREYKAVRMQPIIRTPSLVNPSQSRRGLPEFRLASGGALNVKDADEKEFTIVASGAKVRRKA